MLFDNGKEGKGYVAHGKMPKTEQVTSLHMHLGYQVKLKKREGRGVAIRVTKSILINFVSSIVRYATPVVQSELANVKTKSTVAP